MYKRQILFLPILICLEIYQTNEIDIFMHGIFTIVLTLLTNIANNSQILGAIGSAISGYIVHKTFKFIKLNKEKEAELEKKE